MQKIHNKPNFLFENPLWQKGKKFIAGVDEAGRGPWAGCVVAGAVIFTPNFNADYLSLLNDSKKLSAKTRSILYEHIIKTCDYAVGIATVSEIDKINILQASMLAMCRAIAGLNAVADYVLVDGNKTPSQLKTPSQAIIKGDALSYSIAAASIIAKVTRDKMMADLHQQFPHYGWDTNSGYGTKKHQIGLKEFGITPHHRRSFKPIKTIISQNNT